MGEKVGKKLGEKMGEKTGEKVGESLGEIHKLKLCQNILTTRVLLVSQAGLEATPAENGGAYPWD